MKAFIDGLDTHGGHMVVSIVMILLGAGFMMLGIPEGRDLIVGFAAIIGRSMYGSSNREAERQPKQNEPAPHQEGPA